MWRHYDNAAAGWDSAYEAGSRAPWDIGRPQPAFVRLADGGALSGALLDAGCGTGSTRSCRRPGAHALGIDISPRAIEIARRKATERGVERQLPGRSTRSAWYARRVFDTVLDSGLFHVFDDPARHGMSQAGRPCCCPAATFT